MVNNNKLNRNSPENKILGAPIEKVIASLITVREKKKKGKNARARKQLELLMQQTLVVCFPPTTTTTHDPLSPKQKKNAETGENIV